MGPIESQQLAEPLRQLGLCPFGLPGGASGHAREPAALFPGRMGPVENQQLAEPLWQLGLRPFVFRAGLRATRGSQRLSITASRGDQASRGEWDWPVVGTRDQGSRGEWD